MQNNHNSSPDSYETINVYKIKNQRPFLNIIFYETVRTRFQTTFSISLDESHINKSNIPPPPLDSDLFT